MAPRLQKVLVAMAQQVKYDDYIQNEEYLEALCEMDWDTAVPILKHYLSQSDQGAAAYALQIFYWDAIQRKDGVNVEIYRRKLMDIVEDQSAFPYARNIFCEALFNTEWPGRDEWYISLLKDKSLLIVEAEHCACTPLDIILKQDPKHWIPVLTQLVNDPDRNVHNAAVFCLLSLCDYPAYRKEALKPLLPWLMDPKWADESYYTSRSALISNLAEVVLPESIPGLQHVLKYESKERLKAILALVKQEALDPIPYLKEEFETKHDSVSRRDLADLLLKYNYLTLDESVKIIKDCTDLIQDGDIRIGNDEVSSTKIFGYLLLSEDLGHVNEALARRLLTFIEQEETDPEVSAKIFSVIAYWQLECINDNLVKRLANGPVDTATVRAILAKRTELGKKHQTELQDIVNNGGWRTGLAAVILADQNTTNLLLSRKDHSAQTIFLICSGLLQDPLPLNQVNEFLYSNSPLLKKAAERYLLCDNSMAALELLRKYRHEKFAAPEETFRYTQLLPELKKPEVKEIFALQSGGGWGGRGDFLLIVKQNSAKLRFSFQTSKSWELTEKQLKDFQSFISKWRVDELPPLQPGGVDGVFYVYVHLTKTRVRMVDIEVSGSNWEGTVYNLLVDKFEEMVKDQSLLFKEY